MSLNKPCRRICNFLHIDRICTTCTLNKETDIPRVRECLFAPVYPVTRSGAFLCRWPRYHNAMTTPKLLLTGFLVGAILGSILTYKAVDPSGFFKYCVIQYK